MWLVKHASGTLPAEPIARFVTYCPMDKWHLCVMYVTTDVLLVIPLRKAPSERLQRAAAETTGVELGDEDEAALRFSLRPNAPIWEVRLARFLKVGTQTSIGVNNHGLYVNLQDQQPFEGS